MLFPSLAHAQQEDSFYGKPLIILQEIHYFGLGGNLPYIPTFALYETGQIIYTLDRDEAARIYQVVLSRNELQNVIKHFSIPDSFYSLNDRIEGEETSDLGDNILTISIGQTKRIEVYGYLSDKGFARRKTPNAFLELYDQIRKYRNSEAVEWFPKKIEVHFENYDDYYVDTTKKTPWLADFPDLHSPATNFEHDEYTTIIDGKKFDEFRKYYSSLDKHKTVEINGKRMMISYRVYFPNIQ
jgi:hypothetical protein